ncbi:hypothetical protein [Nocardiopsis sp. MG754419]|uniref:hypothetical protein n=1 Tax=Nocardiopsis sp. MG754419 TaxID=2259865 RepID=UPI001BA6637B|nr:hypothetical protein [Nocardiopsis sp. MG754419]MBR8742386.1 hypothetical protein [Nocardiopsis sp. MG754419]
MATFARTRLVVVAVVLLVPAVLLPLAGLWVLAWLPVALVLLGVALARPAALEEAALRLVRRPNGPGAEGASRTVEGGVGEGPDTGSPRTSRDRSEQGDEPEPLPAPRGESGTRGVRLRRTALPSAADDYDFVFSARVHWRWAGRVDLRLRNPAGPASHSILLRARDVLARTGPEDHDVVEIELSALFAAESPVVDGVIEVWADDVRVELEDEDEERLRRIVRLRKDRALWEAEHEGETFRASLRGTTVRHHEPTTVSHPATSPGSAPARHTEESVEELSGQIIEHFDHPVAGSGIDEEGYESYWWPADHEEDEDAVQQDVQVAILRGLIDSVEDESERVEFARQQVDILERTGFDYVAGRIQAVYPQR